MSGEQMRLVFEDVTRSNKTDGTDDPATGTNFDWGPSAMHICANYDEIVQLRIEGVVAAD